MGVAGVRRVAVWSISLRQLLFCSKCLKPLSLFESFPLCLSLCLIFPPSHPWKSIGRLKSLVCVLSPATSYSSKCLQSICFPTLLYSIVYWQRKLLSLFEHTSTNREPKLLCYHEQSKTHTPILDNSNYREMGPFNFTFA